MTFNFEHDHSDIHSKLEKCVEYKYLREFYLRFNTRGIYRSNLINKTAYKPIEDELNTNLNLRTLCCNTILNSNNEMFIKNSINTVPADLYKHFLKCSLYSMNDFAVHHLITNWPFESLELYKYFEEAYSSLLLYYNTDINSFTGKIAPEILKWLLIGSKYTKLLTNIFLKNQTNPNMRLRRLDITGLPISDRLLKKLVDKYYNSVFNITETDSSDYESVDFFSGSDFSDNSSNTDESDSESYSSSSSNYDLDFDFEPKTLVNNKSKSARFDSIQPYSKKFCSVANRSNNISSNKNISKFIVKIDAILVNTSILETYLNAVKNHPASTCLKFELVVNKLDLTIHKNNNCFIDESFSSTAMKINGLGIFFNANSKEAKYTLQLLNQFRNIQELNLSAFGLDNTLMVLLDNEEFRNGLADALSGLNYLKRLRLNTPSCKNRLEFLLSGLNQPLEYLNLTSCGLTDKDLKYLADSKHANSIKNLVLSNNDLANDSSQIIYLLRKCSSNLEVLDLGCNSFDYETYYKIVCEAITKLNGLKMLITLDVFTFDNYLKIADKLNCLNKFISWRINYSADYYEQSVRINNKFKFRKFKNDYIRTLQNKFETNKSKVKITINDPDLNYILNEIF